MNRFFVEKNEVGTDKISITKKDDIHHIVKVLRLREGDNIEISDSEQWEYVCKIIYIGSELIEGTILDKQKFAREPNIDICLFQGVPKQGKLEMIVQKTTELGISTIVPVFMSRSVVHDKGTFWKKLVRLRSICQEAAKQCGRGKVPDIRKEITFDELVSRLESFDLVLFPYEEEEKTTIKSVLRQINEIPKSIAIIIGPEGGFALEEADKLKRANTACVSLGKTILRTETAGIVALSMCLYELEM